MQQRYVRWEMKSMVVKLNHEIESVYNTRDGQSLNVHRYSSFSNEAKPSDVQRAANSREFLQNK